MFEFSLGTSKVVETPFSRVLKYCCARFEHRLNPKQEAASALRLPLICAVAMLSLQVGSGQCIQFPTFLQSTGFVYLTPPQNGNRIVAVAGTPDQWNQAQALTTASDGTSFCGTVSIAPSVSATVYVPTKLEWEGDYAPGSGTPSVTIYNPLSGLYNSSHGEGVTGLSAFAANIIPAVFLGQYIFWRVSSVQFSPNPSGALTITTASALPSAYTGVQYTQSLTAVGGTSPYKWAILSGTLPDGLVFDSLTGTFSGKVRSVYASLVTVQLTDSAGGYFTLTFSLAVNSTLPTLSRVGAFAQFAAGGGWSTTIYLTNRNSFSIPVSVNLWADDGSEMSLPVVTEQKRTDVTAAASSITGLQLDPEETIVIRNNGGSGTGWAEVLSTSSLSGYSVFHYTSATGVQSEGTVPLESSSISSVATLPYDNTSGFNTGMALANYSIVAPCTVDATAYDTTGAVLETTSFPLVANGHKSFMLTDILPKATGSRGLATFACKEGLFLTSLGLRVNPVGGFTSLPNY